MRPNQTATGGRHGTCSRTHRIRLRWLASQPGRFVDRKGAVACAAMARIARRAIAQARESSSRGSSWLPTRFDARCWDGAAFEQPNVQRSDPRRLAVDTSSRIGSGGRAFRPFPADSEATQSVESRCTAASFFLGDGAPAAGSEQVGTLLGCLPAPGVRNGLFLVPAGHRLAREAEEAGELGVRGDAEGGLCFGQGRVHGVSKSLVTDGSQP